MVLSKDIPTLEAFSTKNLTQVNNVFASLEIVEWFIRCEVDPGLQPILMDYFPIMSVIETKVVASEERRRRNYRVTEWGDFRKALKGRLERMEQPREFTRGEAAVAEAARRGLEKAVMDTIDECMPWTKPVSFEKRWWTKTLRRIMGRLTARHRTAPNDPVHKTYCQVRNKYFQAVKEAKRSHWREWLKELNGEEVWKASWLVDGDATD
ncbi:hypothetical protein CPB83DRAFT_734024, partial [Crepidotus variabilis]